MNSATNNPGDVHNITSTMFSNSDIIEFQIDKLSPFISIGISLVLGLMTVASFLGNGLMCLVIRRSRRLQSTTNYFMFALAVTGIVLSCTIPFLIAATVSGSWIFPDWLCKVLTVLISSVLAADMFLLVGIGLDRYYTIIYPLSFKITLQRSCKMISGSCIVATIIAMPSGYFYSAEPIVPILNEDRMRCYVAYGSLKWRIAPAFLIPLIFAGYIVPAICLITTYWRMTTYIWTFTKGVGSRIVQRTENHVPRAKVKTLKVILIISFVELIIVGIGQVLRCADLIPRDVGSVDLIWLGFAIVQIAPVAKPIICLLCNTSFRRGCREVLCWSQMHCYREELYAVTTVSGLAKRNHIACLPQPLPTLPSFAPSFKTKLQDGGPNGPPSGDTDSDDSSRYCLRRSSVVFDRSNLIGNNWPVQSQNNNTFI